MLGHGLPYPSRSRRKIIHSVWEFMQWIGVSRLSAISVSAQRHSIMLISKSSCGLCSATIRNVRNMCRNCAIFISQHVNNTGGLRNMGTTKTLVQTPIGVCWSDALEVSKPVIDAYIAAALRTQAHPDYPALIDTHTVEDIEEKSLRRMWTDCLTFLSRAVALSIPWEQEFTPASLGCKFWTSRNGLDYGYDEEDTEIAYQLAELASEFPCVALYGVPDSKLILFP